MIQIARTFVDNVEFKNSEYQEIVPVTAELTLNFMIYVLIRDSKLLELRQKLESTSANASLKIFFLFKSYPSLTETLAQVESQDSEAYLYLKKLAKELGLTQATLKEMAQTTDQLTFLI